MNTKYLIFREQLKNLDFSTNIYFHSNSDKFDQTIQILEKSQSLVQAKNSIIRTGLINWIDEALPLLRSKNYQFKTKLYWIVFNLTDFPQCDNEHCSNAVVSNVKDLYQGYGNRSGFKYCCHACSVSSIANKQLHKQTCLKRYGVSSYAKTDEFKERIIKTSLEKYGTINPGCSAIALEKIRQTNIERRGVECSFQADSVKQKSRETFIQHYDVDNNMKSQKGLKEYQDAMEKKYGLGITTNFQLESTKQKSRKTKLERYGNETFTNPEKTKQTKVERYGDPSYFNREKCISTMLRKYGVCYAQQCPTLRAKSGYRYNYNGIKFDSSPELAFYIWLTDHDIAFTYQPDVKFKYLDEKDEEHIYLPDFQVGNQLIEIKGDQYLDKETGKWKCPYDPTKNYMYESKRQCAIKHGVYIMYSAEYQKYIDYVETTYGKHYLKKFKRSPEMI